VSPTEPIHDVERQGEREAFLASAGWPGVPPRPLAADASFRRYFRLIDSGRCAVLMDAPPPRENVRAYLAVANYLRRLDLSAPAIYAADLERGLLLIEDFGDDSYTRLLAAGGDEPALYALAVDTLVAMQRAAAEHPPADLPVYDEERLLTEVSLLVDWYAPAVLGGQMPAGARDEYLACWRAVLPAAMLGTETLVLRDFHVDNLFLLPRRAGVRACGLLDFQDAVQGPASYDLASLLEDARRDVAADLGALMTERYLSAFPGVDRVAFLRSVAILAAQRNAKIIGLFVRLWRRDGKPGYLRYIPRVWRLLEEDLQREPTLMPVAEWLDRHLPPGARTGIRSAA
jgi:aminoglycoside/choline kinase family phosphotransferase